MTSFSFTVTLRMRLAFPTTLFNLQVFENSAANVVVNPIDKSHGNAIQAFEQPSELAILSSIDNGMMELDITKQPMHINLRKRGCEAMTTRSLWLTIVHMPHTNELAMAIVAKVSPTGRILVR
mmetsp:Transcript_24747/g.59657  ORF Transcript_24747/g.59657 Transcript_24747/m.59657 type:complete len:123 (+) Transcript_24747:788-1156(+)